MAATLKTELIAMLPRLRRFALNLTRSQSEADDLVQDACVQAIHNSAKWDPNLPLDRWVFRITRNLWISETRKRKVRLGEGHIEAETAGELVAPGSGESDWATSKIMGQINALPEELSSVLLVVVVEGFSYAETAELLDIPIGTVMSRIHRARKSLAQTLLDEKGELA